MAVKIEFDFSSANQVVFGQGKLAAVGDAAARMGKKAFILAGIFGKDLERLKTMLQASQVAVEIFHVDGEPTIEMIDRARTAAQQSGCDHVIGFGGGSAIDTGKAVAAMLTNPGELLDYLEVVGRNQSIKTPPLPYIAIPTTAGTGSEVTRNAVITASGERVKVSLRSPLLLPRLAVVDPQLTLSLPPAVTASTGMDALTQVIEPFVSKKANAFIDLFCRAGIKSGAGSLLKAYQNGQDEEAREGMAFTSLMGGLALANAGLGAVHGFAGPIGGLYSAPHGVVCACLLSPVIKVNARALAAREPEAIALMKYQEIAQLVTGKENATVTDLGDWVEELRLSIAIPPLRDYGVKLSDLDLLVEKGAVASSMKTNPILLQRGELREILEMAF